MGNFVLVDQYFTEEFFAVHILCSLRVYINAFARVGRINRYEKKTLVIRVCISGLNR